MSVPHLLVSVRTRDEAIIAIDGGANIVDVKEPAFGSLGRASSATIGDIVQATIGARIQLSIALGELCEWIDTSLSVEHESVVANLPGWRPAYAKVGLAGTCNVADPKLDWRNNLAHFQGALSGPQNWVTVAYADHQRARSPLPLDVLEFAVATGSRVLLIDTFQKDHTSLSDWQSRDDLQRLRESTRASGVLLALAGRVDLTMLDALKEFEPDIIAVRGAVCRDGERGQSLCPNRLQVFCDRLNAG